MNKTVFLCCILTVLCVFSASCSKEEPYFPYPRSDEEYLEVSDLSELPCDEESYDDVTSYLTDFTTMLVNESFFSHGDIPNELSEYISEDDFERLCTSYDKKEDCFLAYQIYDIKASHNFQKAIVDVKCNSSLRQYDVYNVRGNVQSADINIPIKVYYVHKYGKWTVEEVVSPP